MRPLPLPRRPGFAFTAALPVRAGCIALAAFTLGGPRPAHAQARPNPAAEYFATQVDREDMIRIPMRDGKRLNSSIYFPRNKPR